MREATVALPTAAIALLVGGRLEGDSTLTIHAVGPLDEAHGGALSFLASASYLPLFPASNAGCVIVDEAFALPDGGPRTRIWVRDAARAMAKVLAELYPPAPPAPSIDPTARLGRGSRLGEGVVIGANVALGANVTVGARSRLGAGVVLEDGVEIGDDCDLGPRVVCCLGSRLGNRVTVKAGAVIGGAGFGFQSDAKGHRQITHVGGCQIGDDASIGSNTCIDRGSVGDTVIGPGTKIDNLVHIAHNARLGVGCLVMAGVLIAGSARIGDGVIISGHAAIGGHFRVGDRVRVSAKAGVASAVPDGTDVSGFPARPHREFLRAQAALFRLAPLVRELEALVNQHRDND